jgi:phage tail tape-measure protein
MAGNYGVGASLGKSGLVGVGLQQKSDASAALGRAADEEQQRILANERAERERKQQNQSLGATAGALAGAQYGSAAGPWGAVIGGVIGGVAGGLF